MKINLVIVFFTIYLFSNAQKHELTLRTNLYIDTLAFGYPHDQDIWRSEERVQLSIQEKEVLINYLLRYSSDSVDVHTGMILTDLEHLGKFKSREDVFTYKKKI